MNEHQPAAAVPPRHADNPRPEEEQMDQEPDRPAETRNRTRGRRPTAEAPDEASSLLQELVAYLRDNRTELREEWARRISEAELLGVMSDEEIFSEATEVYDNYVDALETGSIETLQTYARELSERIIPRGVETHEVLGIVLLLRDVLARSLFAKYQDDLELLNRILDEYEPAANRIAVTVGVSFVEERERVIHDQQEAMRELSTPVLQLRDRLLILPIIGVLDSARARQLTEQLLGAIRDNRATVVVIDITGVATIDRTVANHLVQTVEASRLMGASTILTGLSSEIAQTLVDLDVDLGMMRTVGDLQGGLEEAERLAGYRGRRRRATPPATSRHRRPDAMSVAILRQGDYLIASIQSDLSDSEVIELRHELAELVGTHRARGIVIDVAALDVIDSFVARSLRSIVLTAKLRGAETVIVGIQPDVAIAMVQFRLNLRAAARGPRPGRGDGAARSPDPGGRRGWKMRSASPSTLTQISWPRARKDAPWPNGLASPAPIPRSSQPPSRRSPATSSCTSAVARSSSSRFRMPDRYGLVVIARDDGPGIRDVEAALRDDYSGRGGLGLGLPGARRLMDEFEIESSADTGTTVTMKKWRFRDELARLREERRRRG